VITGVSVFLMVSVLLLADSGMASDKEGETKAKGSLVHCLLPSMIRKYGGDAVKLAPRRVVEITAAECQQQGGEVVVVETAK